MARLNTRPTPAPGSPSANDSETNQRDYSPGKENEAPRSQAQEKSQSNLDVRSRAAMSPLTSSSNNNEARGQKRKRREAERPEGRVPESDSDQRSSAESGAEEQDEEEKQFNRYFDPNQDPEERQETKRKSRALRREFNETRDELLKGDAKALTDTIQRADRVFEDVKQTADATIDSRLLVDVSELAYRKTRSLVAGNSSTGIDPELFLTKCVTFLRGHSNSSTAPSSSHRRRHTQTQTGSDDDAPSGDDDDDDDNLSTTHDWATFGRVACFPSNLRPSLPTFLLGPLSVTRKPRTQTQRTARSARAARETAPEQLTAAQLTQTEAAGASLTATCTRIHSALAKHCRRVRAAAKESGIADWGSEDGRAWLRRHRVSSTGAPGLFEWIVNPWSFSQTVENLFYVSFLIKEGAAGLVLDENELPTLQPIARRSEEEARGTKRHQAILSIDYETWKKVIDAFEIKEPMIPHRDDENMDVGANGWYR